MSHLSASIWCAESAWKDLCAVRGCSNDVCGSCSYCGRPICTAHGFMDSRDGRYYCRNTCGASSHVALIASVVKALLRVQERRRLPIQQIPTEDIVANEFISEVVEELRRSKVAPRTGT